jgi:hypothetical protein
MESAATAAVESSSATVPPTSTLGKRRLRQPTERNHRHQDNTYSKQNGFLHITTLGSKSLQSLDDNSLLKTAKPHSTPAPVASRHPQRHARILTWEIGDRRLGSFLR